ncbi:MAG TPA: hypothetical protein H9683_06845 [Firmicutes bacterium]|nr:hypothetical protein [Bacillota bacterium]
MACQICGKYSGYFPLCKECNKLKDEGKIVKCDLCGTWHYTDNPCKCTTKNYPKNNSAEKDLSPLNSADLTCIICGKPSNGKHFCKSCYFKYKDRSVDLRIKNCSETEILDEYGNLQYKCDDGRRVRSRAEKIISDFLFNNKVRAVYEETIYYQENGETKTLHPDFYLPDYEMYLEYNELTNKPYLKSKEYVQKIYKSMSKKVFIMTEKDLIDIAACLKPLLGLH